MTRQRTPWRNRLVLKLFAAGALVAVVAVVAATFATVQSTTVAIRDSQQQSLHDDAEVYEALIGYGATRSSWSTAGGTVRALGRRYGVRVVVTDLLGRVLASSGNSEPRLPAQARATLDPLNVDSTLLITDLPTATGSAPASKAGICPANSTTCGRYTVISRGSIAPSALARLDTPTERTALGTVVNTCLTRSGLRPALALDSIDRISVASGSNRVTAARCLDDAQRDSLRARVAAPALLFVDGGASQADVFWQLSGRNQLQIVLLALLVLLLTLALCALLARRIVRPLRSMAAAAGLASEGDLGARVRSTRKDELGEVAAAFNDMADRREELELARRRFVSDVSHELRSPLSNIRAWLEGAQDGMVETDDRLLSSLHDETVLLQRLVDDLGDLASGDAGRFLISLRQVELAPLLASTVESFHGSAQSHGIRLVSHCPPDARVSADPIRLRQAVGNVVVNALRHTPSGGEVLVTGDTTRIVVRDSGEGIPPDQVDAVFERFHRVDPSRSRATGGSGLGLAIVRQIMDAHGGTVGLQSEVGVGTTVILDFSPAAK